MNGGARCIKILNIYQKRNNSYYESNLYCPTCLHKPYIQCCNCDNCNEKHKQIAAIKQKEIYNMYGKNTKLIEFSERALY